MELQIDNRRSLESDRNLLEDNSFTRKPEQPRLESLFAFTQRSHRIILALAIFGDIVSGAVFPIFALLLGDSFKALSDYGAGSASVQELNDAVVQNVTLLAVFAFATWISHTAFFTFSQTFGEMQVRTARRRVFNGLINRHVASFDMLGDGTSNAIFRLQRYVLNDLIQVFSGLIRD